MIGLLIAYFINSMAVLLGRAAMILNISNDMEVRPADQPHAPAAKIIANGYVAIGFGGVVLGAIAPTLMANAPAQSGAA